MRKKYVASPTMARFHASQAKFRGIMGPVGSGKSSACCMELFRLAHEVPPNAQGVRRSRYCVVRNTYRELKDTTIKTWLEWVPEEHLGFFSWADMSHRIKLKLRDGTKLDTELMFRALDRPRDVKKLLSLDLTGAWFNEAREVPWSIVEAMDDRCGRFPPADEVVARSCIIFDTNPPDSDHWWARMDMEVLPEDRPEWAFFKQPGGLIEVDGKFLPNPEAENIEHLRPNYYMEKLTGKSKDHVRVYYCSRYGFVSDGRPVIHEYHDETHTAREMLEPVKGLPLIIGLDFGLTPAAAILQRLPSGRWLAIDELVGVSIGARRFGELLKRLLHERYSGFTCWIWGDPAGMARAQTDESTVFDILRAVGLPARPAPTNDATIRREALGHACSIIVDGKPGLLVSPRCVVLRKGLMGGYCYKRLQVAGAERFHDMPDKNQFSHIVEAAEYAMVGGGEGRALVKRPDDGRPRQLSADHSNHILPGMVSLGRQMRAD